MITGRTRVYCILADPIGHVQTPQEFNAFLEKRGVDGVLVPFHVPPQGLAHVLTAMRSVKNLGGIIITIPHKLAIGALCDRLERRAEISGATNVVRREADGTLVGDNFDGIGFVRGIEEDFGPVAGRSAYIMGTGGVGRAIACALAEAGLGRLAIGNRSAQSAADLAGLLSRTFPDVKTVLQNTPPADVDIAINATSVGMQPNDPLPFPVDGLPPNTLVAEVIMQPTITRLLSLARERGLAIMPGSRMLQAQIEMMAHFVGAI